MANIIEKGSFFLRLSIGTAEEDESRFELVLVGGTTPGVRCIETGRTYVVTWDDLVKQAIAAGITNLPGADPKHRNIPDEERPQGIIW